MRWIMLLALWLVVGDAQAVTYNVRVIHICPSEAVCGSDLTLLDAFENLNRRYAPIGMSFRVTIDHLYDPTYAAITNFESPGANELATMAQATPHRITFFVIQGLNDKCWGQPPQDVGDGDPRAYHLFCYSTFGGTAFAHELGHYLCLPHTFTFQDPATDYPVDHDGDGLSETPEDPGPEEDGATADESDDGPGHEWCQITNLPNGFTDVLPGWAQFAGGFKRKGCTTSCLLSTEDGDEPTLLAPLGENGMSYYKSCFGPWTNDGIRHEFFVPAQGERISACIADEPERALLQEACPNSGDSDLDGLCDDEDLCPLHAGLVGMDSDDDNDGIVDGCDSCLGFAGMGFDSDGDFVCDANDIDDDNDTCPDDTDEHPLDSMVVVGHRIGDRPQCTGPIHQWEGTVLPSGIKMCAASKTHDLDGDGIVDSRDYCILEPGLGCIEPVSCPLLPPKWRLVCALGGCNEFELIVVEASNPGVVLARSRFQIVNDVLYLHPAHGQSLFETARTLAGAPPPGIVAQHSLAAGKSTRRRMRFEIRRIDGSLVERVAEVDAASVRLGELLAGKVLALTTDDRTSDVAIAVSWGVGIAPGTRVPDTDGDGIFDAADNCTTAANVNQIDSDEDGLGNLCDPDLDNDGRVTSADAAQMSAAIDGIAEFPFARVAPDGSDMFEVPDVYVRYVPGADLDGDGHVTPADERLWSTLRRGPSGIRK